MNVINLDPPAPEDALVRLTNGFGCDEWNVGGKSYRPDPRRCRLLTLRMFVVGAPPKCGGAGILHRARRQDRLARTHPRPHAAAGHCFSDDAAGVKPRQ